MEGYFPQGVWYDISDDAPVDASTAGRFVKLPAPIGHVPVHVLGGAIVPMQVLGAPNHIYLLGYTVKPFMGFENPWTPKGLKN